MTKANRIDCCLINFLISILCCYFAHDYRNRPFCSPAFFVEFFIHFSNYRVQYYDCPQHIIDFRTMNFKPFSPYNPIYFFKFSIYYSYILRYIFLTAFSRLLCILFSILLSVCRKLLYFSSDCI